MTIDLAGDLLLAILLLTTTTWCILLSRRLKQLRVDRGDVATFVAAVEAAAGRAEAAIAGIREAATEAQRSLGQQREAVDARMAELARLTESGAQMSRRLEVMMHRGAKALAEHQLRRDQGRVGAMARLAGGDPATFTQEQQESSSEEEPRSAPRRPMADLLKALEAMR